MAIYGILGHQNSALAVMTAVKLPSPWVCVDRFLILHQIVLVSHLFRAQNEPRDLFTFVTWLLISFSAIFGIKMPFISL